MALNPKYYDGQHMYQLLPKAQAFSTILTPDNIVIGMFQGKRGANPDLDFKVRILFDGANNKPILPPHTYWVVDLMLKCVDYRQDVARLMQYYINFYNTCTPFGTQGERNNYQLKSLNHVKQEYAHMQQQNQNTLSLDYVAIIIELFSLNEKQTPEAYMFKDLLQKLYDYASGVTNYIELLEAAKPGYR